MLDDLTQHQFTDGLVGLLILTGLAALVFLVIQIGNGNEQFKRFFKEKE